MQEEIGDPVEGGPETLPQGPEEGKLTDYEDSVLVAQRLVHPSLLIRKKPYPQDFLEQPSQVRFFIRPCNPKEEQEPSIYFTYFVVGNAYLRMGDPANQTPHRMC